MSVPRKRRGEPDPRLETLDDLRRLLEEYFRGRKVRVILFGSRARGQARPGSDVDLAFLSEEDLSEDLWVLREILEESHFPYKVDLVDLSKASPVFRQQVERDGVVWIDGVP